MIFFFSLPAWILLLAFGCVFSLGESFLQGYTDQDDRLYIYTVFVSGRSVSCIHSLGFRYVFSGVLSGWVRIMRNIWGGVWTSFL